MNSFLLTIFILFQAKFALHILSTSQKPLKKTFNFLEFLVSLNPFWSFIMWTWFCIWKSFKVQFWLFMGSENSFFVSFVTLLWNSGDGFQVIQFFTQLIQSLRIFVTGAVMWGIFIIGHNEIINVISESRKVNLGSKIAPPSINFRILQVKIFII